MWFYTRSPSLRHSVLFLKRPAKGQRGVGKKEKNQFLLSQSVFQWMLSKPSCSKSLRSSGWIQTKRSWSLCCLSWGRSSTKLMPVGLFPWWKSPSARRHCWCSCSPSVAVTWSTWSPSWRGSPQPGSSGCPQGREVHPPIGRDGMGWATQACLLTWGQILPGRLYYQAQRETLAQPGGSLQRSSTLVGSAFYLGVFQGKEQVPLHPTREVGWSGVYQQTQGEVWVSSHLETVTGTHCVCARTPSTCCSCFHMPIPQDCPTTMFSQWRTSTHLPLSLPLSAEKLN